MKKLSINDIARQLNVAKSTVSFILNGKAEEKRISRELSKKVLEFAEQAGYRPSQLAKSLSTGKTQMICLMVEKISDHFFSHIAYHLEALAYKSGYKIIYCSTENDPDKARELISVFRTRQVDGYIITPPVNIDAEIRDLLNDNLPVVLFDRYLPDTPTDYVGLDNYNGTREAVEHLIAAGSKRIALVTLNSGQTQMLERLSGYMAAIKRHKLKPLVLKGHFEDEMEATVKLTVQFLKDNADVDAILFATNYLALSGIKAINELGLNIPTDIAVIAFDDHDVFNIFNPPISAIAQPREEIAKQLFNTLLDKLENKESLKVVRKIIIQPKLVLRGSTR
ncbi:transcriptional regulator, LacI family [Mucilaginibacter gossypiicola]|uniref:Transcriptional regulator, LacI family n=1 Tax=Mucilaginibacter gossypiicola TaxID=551995 RepID=A0A1H8KUG7_9SPHI|nr:substrate-binding domain-containing protein [Mucilaginibacter gossypiicola]SEN96527.1 transcriptional regulator, LacI family [Mucilaginibacter gossypiicola]